MPFPIFKIFLTALLVLSSMVFLSCRKEAPPSFTPPRESDPFMSAKNIEVLFSDSGQVQAKLISPQLNRYTGELAYTDFPKGFMIFIFDSLGRTSATIKGDRGTRHDQVRTMEAWGHVVVRNELKNEQLETDHLVWDEKTRRIYSDSKVTIRRPDQVLHGSSLEANESFTMYAITDMTGEMMVKQDSL